MTWLQLVLAVTALAACGSKSTSSRGEEVDKKPSAAPKKAEDKPSCKAQVDDLMAFLRAMDHEPDLFSMTGLEQVTRQDLAPRELPSAPILFMKQDGIELDGNKLELDQLAAALTDRHEMATRETARSTEAADPDLLYVTIDARVPWHRITSALANAANARFTHVAFVFARSSPVQAPPRTSFDDKYDAVMKQDAGERASAAMRLVSEVISPCAALGELFGGVGAADPKALIEGTAPALLACECHVDMAGFRSMMWRIIGNAHPVVTVDVTLAKDGAPVALPATTPWRDANTRLERGKKVNLSIRPTP